MNSHFKIVLFSGGRGSYCLHKGLRELFRTKYPHVKLSLINIINAYDDGLSTGVVRNLIPKGILGPSDLRKIQTLQYSFNENNPNIIKFLNYRFEVHREYYLNDLQFLAKGEVNGVQSELKELYVNLPIILQEIICTSLAYIVKLPTFRNLELSNFSFSNLIYAGLAGLNDNDIQVAGTIMMKALNLQDPVYLNSNENFYLLALTDNGQILSREEEIVNYKEESSIYNIFLSKIPLDKKQVEKINEFKEFEQKKLYLSKNFSHLPILSKNTNHAIQDADLIIYSPGTQYSSLYPIYWTKGLASVLCKSTALKIFVTNIINDNEIPGFRAADIVRQAIYFLNEKGNKSYSTSSLIDAVIVNDPSNEKGHFVRPCLTELERIGIKSIYIQQNLAKKDNVESTLHDPATLASLIDKIYIDSTSNIENSLKLLTSGAIAFDLDDTLFLDRRKLLVKGLSGNALNIDHNNLGLIAELLQRNFNLVIISGNDFEVIEENFIRSLKGYLASDHQELLKNLTIYADGSCSKYYYDLTLKEMVLDKNYIDEYAIKREHREVIGEILSESITKINQKFHSSSELFKYYDPQIWQYQDLPHNYKIRGNFSQMIIKPIPSDKHCYRSSKHIYNDRLELSKWIESKLAEKNLSGTYSVLLRGWGTIEIQDARVDKFTALKDYLENKGIEVDNTIYFGNEFDLETGNDFPIAEKGVFVVAVSQSEEELPKLANVIYGGHRGPASTSFHLEHMLEIFEDQINLVKQGKDVANSPVTTLYINKIFKNKFKDELKIISKDPQNENRFLKEALKIIYNQFS